LLSSINNWVPVRLIDERVYCQLMKATKPDEVVKENTLAIKGLLPEISDEERRKLYYSSLD